MKAIIEKAKNIIRETFNREFDNIKEINGLSRNLYCKIKEEVNKMKTSNLFTQEEVERFEEETTEELYHTQLDTKKHTTVRLRKEWEVFK